MLHDMPVGFVPVPGLVAVSSPRTLSPSAASQPSLQHGKRRLYTNLRPHALIRPVAAVPSLPSRHRLSPPHQTLSPPSRWTRSPPSRRTLSPPPPLLCLPSLRCFQNQPFRSHKQDAKTRWRTPPDVWRSAFECTAKTGHFEKSLHLTHTLAARCPNAKFVHKNSLFHGNNYFSAAVLSVSL